MDWNAFLAAASAHLGPVRLVSRAEIVRPYAKENDETLTKLVRTLSSADHPRVAFLTIYDPQYTRGKALCAILRRNGVAVEVIAMPRRPLSLLWNAWRIRNRFDVFILGFRGHEVLPLLRMVLGKRPIVFDALVGVQETLCEDRGLAQPTSPLGTFLLKIDRWLCHLSDAVLTDTHAHAVTFRAIADPMSVHVVYVECDADVFPALPVAQRKSDVRSVLWYGTVQPLHGVEGILYLAHQLDGKSDVHFTLIGPVEKRFGALLTFLKLKNVTLIESVPLTELPRFIAEADVCLAGPFGSSCKARCVITGKTYQMLQRCNAVMVGDTPATRELFGDP